MIFSENKILNLIAEALEINNISLNSNSQNIENWDSLGQLNILSSLDKNLGGKINSIKELVTASSVKEIIKILKSHNLIE